MSSSTLTQIEYFNIQAAYKNFNFSLLYGIIEKYYILFISRQMEIIDLVMKLHAFSFNSSYPNKSNDYM